MDQSNRVDFYILPTPGQAGCMRFACKLAEKAYRMDLRIHALVPDRASAEHFDRMLWTFRQGSFVPHEVLTATEARAPVTIGTPEAGNPRADLLINLCPTYREQAREYPRVAEIVGAAADEVSAGRARFRQYREFGFTIETHDMGSDDG